MTQYIHSLTGTYPVSEAQIRADNPNTSFGVPFIAPEQYKVVFPAPQPTHDPLTQYCVEVAPMLTNKGHWEQNWDVVDKSAEVIAAEAEARRIAAIPASVSPRQIREALIDTNLIDAVETAVAAGDRKLQNWWERASDFQRNHPKVIAMGEALGISPQQLDDLWILAGSL